MKEGELNKMIKEEPWKFIDILNEIIKPLHQLLPSLTKYQYDFINKIPSEKDSDDEPPIKFGKKVDIIPIDGYLGLYDPNNTEITIYNKGIENASKIIKCDPEHLKFVVKIHEWSHAFIHLSVHKSERLQVIEDDNYWKKQLTNVTQIYFLIENKLHEHLAQLLTYYSLNMLLQEAKHNEAKVTINRIIEVFQELSKRQPSEYVVDAYLEVPQSRVIESVNLIKKGWLKGIFDAWDTIIKW